ncbi:MAG TPA: permease-like cell division protein FtsX [Gaiellaceae bacterium]|jgi:cell division transport system permease protein|nr:permease-like cell division protein FtsX [Gaiellaceae bacterium]
MRARLLLSESVRSLAANLSTTIAATMTVLIGMFLLGLFIAIGSWAQDFGAKQKEKLLVKVYFCTETTCAKPATEAQINVVRRQLETNSLVAADGVTFVSKAEALERMRKRTPEIVENLTSNPLPDAFEVRAKDGADVRAIGAALRNPLPAGVEEVKDGEEISDRVINAARIMSTAFAIATLVLLVSSALLIANTIRLSIFSRRREIEVMKLVGATNWFVRGPFMLEGLICGILGSAAAVLLLLVGKELVLPSIFDRLDSASDVTAWPFHLIALVILGVGLTVGAIGSGVTMRRFLNV